MWAYTKEIKSIMFGAVVGGLMAVILVVPLLVYHFLMFPNLNGVVQDLAWYNYDDQSEHFLYWFGFWFMGVFGFLIGNGWLKSKDE